MTSYEDRLRFARARRLQREFDESRRRSRSRLALPTTPEASRCATVAQVVDPEVLIGVFDEMAATGGPGPGLDGVSYADLCRSDMCRIMREISSEILEGTFVPSKTRKVRVEKAHSKKMRTLRLLSIPSRVVAGTTNRAVTPKLESVFHERSFGFRRGRGTWEMLAALERDMFATGRFVLAQDDIVNAFDNVPIDLVVAEFRRLLADEGLVNLIATLLRGHNRRRRRGIDQGSPISPAGLNVLLHAWLDLWLDRRADDLPWFRYADNLVVLAHDTPEAGLVLREIEQRLQETTGLTLKGKDPIVDLAAGKTATCLGFNPTLANGALKLDITQDNWQGLEKDFQGCWKRPRPSRLAQSLAEGWITSQGPALETDRRTETITKVLRIAARAGFRKLDRERLQRAAEAAHEQWQRARLASPRGEAVPAPPAAATSLSVA